MQRSIPGIVPSTTNLPRSLTVGAPSSETKQSNTIYLPADRSTDQRLSVSMPEILSAFSFALDLTEDAVPGHALRSCLIALRLAAVLQLSEEQRSSLYYAMLLKDVGCSSNAARMCQIIGGGDDRAVKAGVKLEDWTRPHRPSLSALRLLWSNVSPHSPFTGKAAQIFRIALTQHKNNEEMIALRCDRGANIVRKIGVGAEAAETVRCLDEHWDGGGYPARLRGQQIPLLARIACASQHIDVFATKHGPQRAINTLNERSGRWFDPEIVKAANALYGKASLQPAYVPETSSHTLREVVDLAPSNERRMEGAGIDLVCEAFAEVVDAKSPFTNQHSAGMTVVAVAIARNLGLGAERMRFVYRAALLHDLGKLSIPNSILDKNGPLTDCEWSVVRQHPVLTRQILQRIRAFDGLGMVAGAHHEKLDGSGYPDHLQGNDIPLEARILAVADVYSAVTEDRPYRLGMEPAPAFALMRSDVPRKLDRDCFTALMNTIS